MTGLMLREKRLNAVVRPLVQYSRIIESSYDASFREVHTSDMCKYFLFCGLLQGVDEDSCRGYVCVTGLMRHFSQPYQLVKKVSS